jgi:hypothetical protein
VIILGQCISARLLPKSEPEQSAILEHKKQFSCTGRPDGVYADVPTGCRQFHRCMKGQQDTMQCPVGTLFDAEKMACVLAEAHVVCGNIYEEAAKLMASTERIVREVIGDGGFDCKDKETGYYADYSRGCRQFYFCHNGNRKTRKCPDGTVFDELEVRCAKKEEVTCVQSPDSITTSGNKRQIKFQLFRAMANQAPRSIRANKRQIKFQLFRPTGNKSPRSVAGIKRQIKFQLYRPMANKRQIKFKRDDFSPLF